MKVESPGTESDSDFGGMTPRDALNADIAKLARQKALEDMTSSRFHIQRCRYWFVMLAFSAIRRGHLKGWTRAEWTVADEWQSIAGPMVVCLKEV